MLTCLAWLLGICLPGPVNPPAVLETWEAAYLDGARIGYCQTSVQTLGEGTERLVRTTTALELALRRNTALVRSARRTRHRGNFRGQGRRFARPLPARWRRATAPGRHSRGDRMRVVGKQW